MKTAITPTATLYTIGYEGRTVAGLLAALRAHEIERLLDIRALPLSRRRGFSKTSLSLSLCGEGIEYVHLRAAGNPFRHMSARIQECLALYRNHLEVHPEIVSAVYECVVGRRAALLCVEADARNCHRSILAEKLRDFGLRTVDL